MRIIYENISRNGAKSQRNSKENIMYNWGLAIGSFNCFTLPAGLGKTQKINTSTDKKLFQRLFFVFYKTLTDLNKVSEKAAPFDVANNTKQSIRPSRSITKRNCNLRECSCAQAGQNPRSDGVCLDFFVSFCVQDKKKDEKNKPQSTQRSRREFPGDKGCSGNFPGSAIGFIIV